MRKGTILIQNAVFIMQNIPAGNSRDGKQMIILSFVLSTLFFSSNTIDYDSSYSHMVSKINCQIIERSKVRLI